MFDVINRLHSDKLSTNCCSRQVILGDDLIRTMLRRYFNKGLVTHMRFSLNIDLYLIAKNSVCLFDLLLYVPVNSYGHVGKLAVERDVKQ